MAATTPLVLPRRVRRAATRRRASAVDLVKGTRLANALTGPFLYAQALPLFLLDLSVTAYQWICFPIYGVERVNRGRYFAIDRHRLAYLGIVEKMNCTYCAYADGVLAYVREVTARTEAYWCPIKHRSTVPDPHGLYEDFFEFGDARGYRHGVKAHRRTLRRVRHRPKATRTDAGG